MPRASKTINSPKDRKKLAEWCMRAPDGWTVEFKPPTRSSEQNALMWSLLGQVAKQVEWYGEKRCADDWKDMFTASLRGYQSVPGIDAGRILVIGMRTSKMGIEEMNELIELIYSFGAEHEVKFRELEPT